MDGPQGEDEITLKTRTFLSQKVRVSFLHALFNSPNNDGLGSLFKKAGPD